LETKPRGCSASFRRSAKRPDWKGKSEKRKKPTIKLGKRKEGKGAELQGPNHRRVPKEIGSRNSASHNEKKEKDPTPKKGELICFLMKGN